MSEGQESVRKRIRDLKTSLELSTENDVIDFLLHHFDDKALEVNIERGIIFEDGRRAGRAEMESRICAEVSERLKAVMAPHFKRDQELLDLKRDKEALQQRVAAQEKELAELEADNKEECRLQKCIHAKMKILNDTFSSLVGDLKPLGAIHSKRHKHK